VGSLPRRTAAAPGDAASARAVWVPARNVVLVAAAAACAEAAGAEVVLAGFNREEAATFPDNSAEFRAAMTAALALGTSNRVRVESPTQDLDKAGIAGHARRLGLARTDFWSCYEDRERPCETCESCVRSRRAFGA
jgi:7-cyano-7-deazaguanine synthase